MFERKPKWRRERTEYLDALDTILEWFPFEPEQRFHDSLEDRAKLFECSTSLIRTLINSFSLRSNTPNNMPLTEVHPDARRVVEVLKQFIWEYVIENPDLAVPQNGQREAVRNVFTQLLKASQDKKYYLFPPAHQGQIAAAASEEAKVRIVADCISGMTEKEVMHIHRNLQGLL